MALTRHTYAIRLAVEGGDQVKTELVSVGQSGEQSLKRIESAGERSSGGLKRLDRQAELLRAGIRTPRLPADRGHDGRRLAALVDRSISAADAIGKTADKIGVGVEALQELRFASKASRVEQPRLAMRYSASPAGPPRRRRRRAGARYDGALVRRKATK